MKKRILVIFLILVLTLTGCGNISSNEGGRIVIDSLGREVMIPENPQRVACLYASTAHIMAMLDEGDKIVGAPEAIKKDVLMNMKYPRIKEIKVPAQSQIINGEEMLALDVDLALIRYQTANSEGEVEKLDKIGIPYVVVDYENEEELKRAIEVMGSVFKKEEKAKAYVNFFDETVNLVKERIKDIPKKKTVYHSVNEAIRTDKEGDLGSQVIDYAGGDNVSLGKSLVSQGDKTYTTIEEIYKWQPEYIFANESSVSNYIRSDGKWQGLKAVKEKNVYTLPVGATRWGHPGSIEAHMATLFMAKTLYPERFEDINLEEYTKGYYKEYFKIDLNDETVKKTLEGYGMRKSNGPKGSN